MENAIPVCPRDNIKKKAIKEQIKNYPFAGIILNCSCPFRSDSDKKCPIYEVRPNICQSFLCSKSPDKIRSEKMLFYKKYPLVDMRQEFFRTK